jgi:hypothetical protein
MGLRDRIQRWWRPAQWADDHSSQASDSAQEKKHWWQGGRWFFRVSDSGSDHTFDSLGPDIERDFKKPR